MNIRTFATLAFSLLAVFACSTNKEADKWDQELQKYRKDDSVKQIILVKCSHDQYATASLYLKDNNKWVLYRTEDAIIGSKGLGKKKEGDKKTPDGDFPAGTAFGIKPNPGTSMEYIDITESIYACDENCEYYNKIIDTNVVHHECHGEHMIKCVPAYNYGFHIGYNPENIYPLGSAIFFHCIGSMSGTAGCVSVKEDFMKEILMKCEPGLRVIIHQE